MLNINIKYTYFLCIFINAHYSKCIKRQKSILHNFGDIMRSRQKEKSIYYIEMK